MILLAEKRYLPDRLIRFGIRRLLASRLQTETLNASCGKGEVELASTLPQQPITVHAQDANAQHYEVPAEFFVNVLGSHLKYSCGYWEPGQTSLDASEAAMLQLTCERAGLSDGMQILELGCGWGSLTLWMAEHYPESQIVAVSNSQSQRQFIMRRARERGLNNVTVLTCDIAQFETEQRFDRVVSVEMFEHVRNHARLLEKVSQWLSPEGEMFVHIFCHRNLTYLFQPEGRADWMARHFFTGGMMPSRGWLSRFDQRLSVSQQWTVDGTHYQKTSEAWLRKLDQNQERLVSLFAKDMSLSDARRQLQRWRMFFMACAELFGYRGGNEWFVEHYRFQRVTPPVAQPVA